MAEDAAAAKRDTVLSTATAVANMPASAAQLVSNKTGEAAPTERTRASVTSSLLHDNSAKDQASARPPKPAESVRRQTAMASGVSAASTKAEAAAAPSKTGASTASGTAASASESLKAQYIYACRQLNARSARALLKQGISAKMLVNAYDTGVHWAAKHRDRGVPLMRLLLRHGGEVNRRRATLNGETPMHLVTRDYWPQSLMALDVLLSAGGDPTAHQHSHTKVKLSGVEVDKPGLSPVQDLCLCWYNARPGAREALQLVAYYNYDAVPKDVRAELQLHKPRQFLRVIHTGTGRRLPNNALLMILSYSSPYFDHMELVHSNKSKSNSKKSKETSEGTKDASKMSSAGGDNPVAATP